MSRRSNSNQYRNLVMCVCKDIAMLVVHARFLRRNISEHCFLRLNRHIFCILQKMEVSTQNVPRIFQAHLWKKSKNVEPRRKNSPFLH